MVADLLHLGSHSIVVSDSLLALRSDLISTPAGIHHCINSALHSRNVVGDRFNRGKVLRSDTLGFLGREKLLDFIYIVEKERLIAHGSRNHMVHGKIAEHTALNLYLLGVHFPFHLIAGCELLARKNAGLLKHLHILRMHVDIIHQRSRSLSVETATSSLFLPFIRIAVAVKLDSTVCLDQLLNLLENSLLKFFTFFNASIHSIGEIVKLGSHCSIKRDEGRSTVGRRSDSTIFETVACEGKRRSTVAVGVINHQLRNLSHIKIQPLFPFKNDILINLVFLNLIKKLRKLRAKEHRDNSRRSFISAKTMGIGGIDDRSLQKSVVFMHGCHDSSNECDEAEIVESCLSGSKEKRTGVCAERPVVMFAATVDSCERFFMKQHAEIMTTSHLFHHRHQEKIVVVGKVAFLVDRGELKLVGRHLVMASFSRDSEFMAFIFEIEHERFHTLWNRTEIMVFKLLILCRFMTHEGASGHHKVGTGCIESLINKEILLLPSKIADHMLYVGVEIASHASGSLIHAIERTEKGSLIVEALSGVGDEYGRDTQGIVENEGRR